MPQRQDVSLECTAHQVLVVADDFTGANDAGVGLALQQAQVNVILELDALTTGALHEVTVINTDSRAQSAQDAALRIVHTVAAALGATGFHIKGQLASCVPWGRFIDSIVGDIPVMTKAGGFGDEATLHHVLRFFEERVSE